MCLELTANSVLTSQLLSSFVYIRVKKYPYVNYYQFCFMSCYVAQSGVEVPILLPQSPED